MNSNPPLITIITCTKNSGHFLTECLKSVNDQTYRHFEHIFIDTNSTDQTHKIIKNYHHNNVRLINFPTPGIYQAFNEGLRQAKGDVIGFLHSDDTFTDIHCLERIAMAFNNNPEIKFYCSQMNIYNQDFNIRFAILGAPPHKTNWREDLYSIFYFAHPTYFCKSSAVKKVGFYNESYHYAGDSDWLKRLELLNLQYYFDTKPLINFRTDGTSAKHYLEAFREECGIKTKYEGFSLKLILIFTWHLFRRTTKLLLNIFRLNKIIFFLRKLILKNFKT